jgi:anti-sigma regulatory factor (Ser/Thr protein kinase)
MVLMTSELVTNAVVHAGSRIDLVVEILARSMRVEVQDQSSKWPEIVELSQRDRHGRGLAIIEKLSDQWGVTATDSGKTVWFVLNQARERPGAGDASVPKSQVMPADQN